MSIPPLRFGDALATDAFSEIRRTMALEAGKWDLRCGDVETLASFPLLLRGDAWELLSEWAEALTRETLALEASLARRPEWWPLLGVPRNWEPPIPPEDSSAGRVFRFDFHPTAAGWCLSEVNSDVPGGFAEATEFPALMAHYFPATEPCGAPGRRWVQSIQRAARGGLVGLLSAPGFLEDQQVTTYLAHRLEGVHVQPRQLAWAGGRASLRGTELGALVRFYQGEWLLRSPEGRAVLQSTATPILNPGRALLSESKRLPLLWDRLGVSLPAWRALLPESRDPREVPWRSDETWVLKKGLSNTGDFVRCIAWEQDHDWPRQVQARPQEWVAQRRFETISTNGLRPCLGVYTVDGKTAGAYGRISNGPVIDSQAQDVAVLVEKEETAPPCATLST